MRLAVVGRLVRTARLRVLHSHPDWQWADTIIAAYTPWYGSRTS